MSSSAPKRRLDVRQQTSQRSSGRRAATRRGRRSFRPTPAIAGAFALVAAGIGSSVASSHTDRDVLSANYQTISANYTGGEGDAGAGATVDVSRDFDRDLLEKQITVEVASDVAVATGVIRGDGLVVGAQHIPVGVRGQHRGADTCKDQRKGAGHSWGGTKRLAAATGGRSPASGPWCGRLAYVQSAFGRRRTHAEILLGGEQGTRRV